MTQDEKLARNIRCLREAFGETQEELAFSLGVSKNAVSNYECGTRRPKPDVLAKIAEHFTFSTEEILNDDYSALLSVNPDVKKMRSSIRILFPIIGSESAMEDRNFRIGIEKHRALYKCLAEKNPDVNLAEELSDAAWNAYSEVDDDTSKEVAEATAANVMALWFLLFFFVSTVPDVMAVESAPIERIKKVDHRISHAVERYRFEIEDDPTAERDRKALVRDLTGNEASTMVMDILKMLKSSSRLGYLADYYLALRFVVCMVPNGLGVEINRRLGTEMMDAFAALGNPMAKRFSRFGRESWRPKYA